MRDVVSFPVPTTTGSPLTKLERRIDETRRTLRELWWQTGTADRLFAVDRLLRDDLIAPGLQAQLQAKQDAVRNTWITARVAAKLDDVAADAQLADLQLTMAERDRDNFMEEHQLFDPLFMSAESYLRPIPIVAGGTFRELVHERERMRAKLVPILPPVDDEASV
jgi:hypothetical protein